MDLRKLARDKPCILCGSTGTTVLHHVRVGGNAGMREKPPDWPWGIRLCADCHRHVHGLDGSPESQRWKNQCQAMGQQQIQYATEGILQWP